MASNYEEDTDDSGEYEEERTYVMIDLQGVFDPEALLKGNPPMKIVGIDSEAPVLQIGNCVFSGTYEETLGTMAFFDKPKPGVPDSGKAPCVCTTDKKLTMRRVFLEPKDQISEPVGENEGLPPNEAVQHVTDAENVVRAALADNFNLSEDHRIPKLMDYQNAVGDPEPPKEFVSSDRKNTTPGILNIKQSLADQASGSMDYQAVKDPKPPKKLVPSDEETTTREISNYEQSLADRASGSMDYQAVKDPKLPKKLASSDEETTSREISNYEQSLDQVLDDALVDSVSNDPSKTSAAAIFLSPSTVASKDPELAILTETRGSDVSEVETDRSSEFDDLVILSELEESNEATGERYSSPTDTARVVSSAETLKDVKLSDQPIDMSRIVFDKGAGSSTDCSMADAIPELLDFILSHIQDSGLAGSSESESNVDSPSILAHYQDLCQSSSNISPEEDTLILEQPGISTSQPIAPDNTSNQAGRNSGLLQVIDANSGPGVSGQGQVIDSNFLASSISESDICEMGSTVNSTVSDAGETSNRSILSLTSLNNQGNEARSSTTPNYEASKSIMRSAKSSVDSTSNKIFQPNERQRNYKSNSGIDSTTNESGDRLMTVPVGSPLTQSIASSSNSGVDSTLNNLPVDFEIREVGASEDRSAVEPNIIQDDLNHSIDSTSNVVSCIVAATHSSDNQEDVSDSISATCPPVIELIQNNQPCEVSESCSERGVQISNSEAQGNDAVALDIEQNYPDESSLFCNVTESHMDENIRIQLPSTQGGDAARRLPSDQYDNLISESHQYEDHELNSYSDIQLGTAQSISHSASNEVSESCSSSENRVTLDPTPGHLTARQNSPRQSQGQDIDSSSNNRIAESFLGVDPEMSVHISGSVPEREQSHASSSVQDNQRLELITGSLQHVTASSDCNIAARGQPDSPSVNDNSLPDALEANREAAVCDISSNIAVDGSYRQEGSHDIETLSLERMSVRGDDEVSESSVFYTRARSHMVSEELCSEADALDAVSDSRYTSRPVIANQNSSEQNSFCEVSESDENIIYIVPSPDENENEVTVSCTSDLAERSQASNVIDLVVDDDALDVILVSSEQDEAAGFEPCVSSNEQLRTSFVPCNISSVDLDAQEILDTQGPDSRPSSSSKEQFDPSAATVRHVYDIESSPETESLNDPCSSSSNKFLSKDGETSEHDNARKYYDVESLGCCSTSDVDQLPKSYKGVQELAERLLHNEAEVTESRIGQDSRLAWDASESNTDEEGTLYIVTDSPGAEVSESCATSSDQHRSRQAVARSNLSAESSPHSASVTESNIRQLTFEATRSNVVLPTADIGSSSDSDDQGMSFSHAHSAKDTVSNSSEAFHSSYDIVNIPDDPEDSSSCEVTESCINNRSRSDASESTSNRQFPGFPMHVSPSSSVVASTSQGIMPSRLWESISSTASSRPSTSGLGISSATDASDSSVVVSSANEISRQHSETHGDSSLSVASTSSGSASQSMMADNASRSAASQVTDSNAENPADSSDDRNTGNSNRYVEQPSEGSDSLKLPSSTSNE